MVCWGGRFVGHPRRYNMPLKLQLYHTQGVPNEGVYKAIIKIGGIDFHVIVDTCSSDLVVRGHCCSRTQLHDVGSWPLGHGTATGEQSVVVYGSQTNRIAWYKDEMDMVPGALFRLLSAMVVAQFHRFVRSPTIHRSTQPHTAPHSPTQHSHA
jgi:hypothetical protein